MTHAIDTHSLAAVRRSGSSREGLPAYAHCLAVGARNEDNPFAHGLDDNSIRRLDREFAVLVRIGPTDRWAVPVFAVRGGLACHQRPSTRTFSTPQCV